MATVGADEGRSAGHRTKGGEPGDVAWLRATHLPRRAEDAGGQLRVRAAPNGQQPVTGTSGPRRATRQHSIQMLTSTFLAIS